MPKKNIVERVDMAVAEPARVVRRHPLTRLAGAASEIADQPQAIALCCAVIAAGALRSDARLAKTGGRMLAAELFATFIKSAVKDRVIRTRPHAVDDGETYRMHKGEDRSSELSSFPSGHTAGAVAVALAATREYPGARMPALAAAGAIALVQIPRCKHFVSDLAAGAFVGVAADQLVGAAERLLLTSLRPVSQTVIGSAADKRIC